MGKVATVEFPLEDEPFLFSKMKSYSEEISCVLCRNTEDVSCDGAAGCSCCGKM